LKIKKEGEDKKRQTPPRRVSPDGEKKEQARGVVGNHRSGSVEAQEKTNHSLEGASQGDDASSDPPRISQKLSQEGVWKGGDLLRARQASSLFENPWAVHSRSPSLPIVAKQTSPACMNKQRTKFWYNTLKNKICQDTQENSILQPQFTM